MLRTILLSILISATAVEAWTQTVSDVLRYSYLQPVGPARFTGVGGAFTALGAEFASASQNPAGIAMFRSGELAVTPTVRFNNSSANLPGQSAFDDDKSSFALDHVGIVFGTNPGGKWKTFNVGIGLNRQAAFTQTAFYEGNGRGSIVNPFYQEVDQIVNQQKGSVDNLYPFGAKLAVESGAVFPDNNNYYYSDFLDAPDTIVNRSQAITSSGGINEMVISLAGNYQEKFMIGATLGVPFVRYRFESDYNETDPTDNVTAFENLNYTENLRTDGVGINAKIGFIYRVNQSFRIGGAFHTPTWFGLTDQYYTTMRYAYNDGTAVRSNEARSTDGNTDYRLRTPWRAMAGAAFLFRKYGFLSADLEWLDYGANRYNLTADVASTDKQREESDLNRSIQRTYQRAMNVRVGAEVALEQFRLRGGFNIFGDPTEGNSNYRTAFTLGTGIRGEDFYMDLAFRRYLGSDGSIQAYSGAPTATLESRTSDVQLTLGLKF